MKPYLFLAVPLLVAAPLVAQQMAMPGAKDAARVAAGTYAVDPAHTLVRFTVDHLGFSTYFGIFGDATGTLTLDPKNLGAAKVDITIPVGKVTTASAGLTKHLQTADFFDAATHPTARFVSTSVTRGDDADEAKVAGNLTIKGITKPVVLDVEFHGAGKSPAQMGGKETIGFDAETTIKRSDFGINYAIPAVPDAVELDIAVAFEKQ